MTTRGNVEIKQYGTLLLRRLWLIILGAVLAGAVTYYVGRHTTPIYQASTTLLIKEGQSPTGSIYGNTYMSSSLGATYSQLLTSKPVLQEAAARLGVSYQGTTSATQVGGTPLIRLSVTHPDPAQAALLANTIPKVFIEGRNEEQSQRLASSKDSLQREMKQLEDELNATQVKLMEEQAKELPNDAELARLENLLAQRRSTYAGLLQTYEGIRVSEIWGSETLSVIEAADVPVTPIAPNTRRDTLMAVVVGAILAMGVAVLIEYLDDTIKTTVDVEQAVHLPTLATIARLPSYGAEGEKPLVAVQSRSGVAEAYRVLRTNLQFAVRGAGHSAVTLLVTSAQPLEGKTTTVANLGTSLALAGKRVLLVDADLRRPALHKQFGLGNATGLTSFFLDQKGDLEGFIQKTDVEGLRLLSAGSIPPNPGEVLGFPETDTLFDWLRASADYLIVDCPPVLCAADASILAQKVDGVLIVAEAGKTSATNLQRTAAMLKAVQAHLLGVILNKAQARSGDYYYYHYYGERQAANVERKRRKADRPAAARDGLLGRLKAGRRPSAALAQGPTHTAAAPAVGREDSEEPHDEALSEASVSHQDLGPPVSTGEATVDEGRQERTTGVPWIVPALGAVALVALALALLIQLQGGNLARRSQAAPAEPLLGDLPSETLEATPTGAVQPTPFATATADLVVALATAQPAQPAATRALTSEPPTEAPTATSTIPATATRTATLQPGPHGVSSVLRLRDDRSEFAGGERVFFALEIRNETDKPVSFGVLELRVAGDGAFRTPWADKTIAPHSALSAEYYLVFGLAGEHRVAEAICFSPSGACGWEGADWEVFSPGVTVTIV